MRRLLTDNNYQMIDVENIDNFDSQFAVALERIDDDLDLFKTIARMFVEDHVQMLAALRTHLLLDQREQAEQAAHAIKGAISNFAADAVGDLAFTIENECRQANLEGARALLPSLHIAVQQLSVALQRYCANHGA